MPQSDSETKQKPPTPRWVKIFAWIAIAAMAVLVILSMLSGTEHGPGLHGGGLDQVLVATC
ncbi:MAG: hypothetical protein KIS80_02240 [Anaerolineales bacterium]|nr:hypothetical protein [Anaerolineales bacterium]